MISWAVICKFLPKGDEGVKFGIGASLSVVVTTLLLYYSLMLVPSHSDLFYFILISLAWVVLGIFSFKELKENIFYAIKVIQKRSLLSFLIFIGAFLFFVILCLYIDKRPMTEHDTFEYAVQGRIFYKEKLIAYSLHRFNDANNFYYVGLHGFSFPLILTWENIANFNVKFTNYFFKAISGWYAGILLLLSFFILKKIDLISGIVGVLAIAFVYGFFIAAIKFHIDTFRIFLMVSSVYLMMKYLLTNQNSFLWMSAVICGLHTFVHSSGVFLSGALFLSAFLFSPEKVSYKIKLFTIATIIFILFGGIHYVLEVTIGTKWIFKNMALDFTQKLNEIK